MRPALTTERRRARRALRGAALPLLLAAALAPAPAAAGDAWGVLRRRTGEIERRTRIEDLHRSEQRRREALRARGSGDPAAVRRLEERWRAQDALRDLERDRERERLEDAVRREQAEIDARRGARLPDVAAPTPGEHAERQLSDRLDALERRLHELERRERLERLRRDARGR